MKPRILNLVAFLILMEEQNGVAGKPEDYIMEKFNRYVLSEKEDEFLWGLDSFNENKLRIWRSKWGKNYKTLNSLKK